MRTRTLPRHARTGQLALGWRKARPGEDPAALYPVWPILGGAEDGDSGDQGDGDQGDSGGDSDQGGDNAGSDTDGDGTDWRAEAEKWKTQARKHEGRAKENSAAAKELAKIKREGMPEQERAVAEAVAKALGEERAKNGAKLARQAFLAAAKGVIENASDVADDVNLHRYVNDDGEIDEAGLDELVKRLAPKKSDTDPDEDDDREGERDTRRRRRGAGFDQGARRRGSSGNKSRGSVDSGRELYAALLGKKGADNT